MKPHYAVLDGLRGTAAVMVVIYHLCKAMQPVGAFHLAQHAYLSVDFFFVLSGFVIAYAYNHRWGQLTVPGFLKMRLIRLHPLAALSILIGGTHAIVIALFNHTPIKAFVGLIGWLIVNLTLIPVRNHNTRWPIGETHNYNGPLWSLMQEYVANIAYAVIGHKLTAKHLVMVIIPAAVLLVYTAFYFGNLEGGWSFNTLWVGFVRSGFSFSVGLLLFKLNRRIYVKAGYLLCSAVLIAVFMVPTLKHNGSYVYNAIFDAGCIIVVFPLVVMAGAGSIANGFTAKICKFSGDVSYPIYVLHFPFINVFTEFTFNAYGGQQPDYTAWILPSLLFFVAIAYLGLKYYDEPVRAWLKRKFLKPA